MHDVFISYEHESKTIADNIVNYLESRKVRCWYAPRDVIGDYATSICNAIADCKVFVLILNEQASNSDHCLNEVEMAYLTNVKNAGNITIMPLRVDDKDLNRAMEYYVKRLHWIDATNNNLENAIGELYNKVASILGIDVVLPARTSQKIERYENKYDVTEKQEEKRLKIQLAISKEFDQPSYDAAVEGKEKLVVLDVGGNNGSFVMDRLGNKPEVEKIIGLEYYAESVAYANSHYSDKCKFYQCDVEDPNFEETLEDVLSENGIEKVDIINVSMLVLHLKNPAKLLKILRKYLKANGTIIVKDIDDGLNFCNPDPDGKFQKAIEICSIDHDAGYRLSGRQVFTLLANAGYSNIRMDNACLSTAGFDYDKKQLLFDTYFGFILSDMKKLSQEYPNNKKYVESYEWLKENFDDMEDEYHMSNFIFNVGFVIFSAKK